MSLLSVCGDNYFTQMETFCLVDPNLLKNVWVGHGELKVYLSTREVAKIGQLHIDQSKSRK